MFSQQLAKFKIETKIKTSLRARGPPGVSGALCSLRILRIGRIGSDCDCSGVIQVPGNHHLSGPEVGQSHWLYREKGPAEAVFPPPAKEVQPASGAADTVLLCHHRVCPMFFYNCLVWFSYQNRHQKTTTDSQDCWKDYRCPSAQLPRTLHLQSEEKG